MTVYPVLAIQPVTQFSVKSANHQCNLCWKNAAVALLLLLLASGCQSPTFRIHQLADRHGLQRSNELGGGFKHLVLRNRLITAQQPRVSTPRVATPDVSVLNVYLEGDGTPWRYRKIIMSDPTPRRPLMLELMLLDPSPAVYLGRPCYNGSSLDDGCSNLLWTSARYSKVVINSMSEVINKLLRQHSVTQLRLFGHSGGAALSMLLAEQIPAVTDVITIAGNLDTDAWTTHHGYTPLYSSLNPARQAPLRDSVIQWHFIGELDAVIPPGLIKPFIQRQTQAYGFSMRRFSHGCCWEKIWPVILKSVRLRQAGQLPGRRFKLPNTQPLRRNTSDDLQ